MKFLTVLFMAMPFLGSAQNSIAELLQRHNGQNVPYISVEELKMKRHQDEKVIVLDAREPEEYQVSHLKNAKFVGSKEFSIDGEVIRFLNKSTPIVVYCSVGIRSEKVGEKLQKAGFTQVNNLFGGIFAWKNKGYKVYDASEKPTEKVHAYSNYWGQYLKKGEKVYAVEAE